MTAHHYMTVAQRRATAESLRIAASVDQSRPILRTLMVRDGRAFVTDSYRLVVLPWLDGLPEGNYDADALYRALKGAGRDCARIASNGDGTLTVTRFEPWGSLARIALEELPDELGDMTRGTFKIPTVEGTAPDVAQIVDPAFADVTADDYAPSGVPAFNGEFLASLLKCHPSVYERKAGNNPLTVRPRGDLKPMVVCNGQPFAILMPMRVR